ncbi:MAG TPA: efflux RND transporter periplasmic adaptor subunit [Phycisphaerae bacterium]|nr:efflux RND transporter periplasmic adaptor subunit [Phycisphaerae bacterium]
MQNPVLSLSGLAAEADLVRGAPVPRPRSRWKTRVALPFAILGTAGGLLAHAARIALVPAVEVWVVPVVGRPVDVQDRVAAPSASRPTSPDELGRLLVQAPGWVEAAPYAINVPALAEGVVREVLVLEGDRVEAEQVIVRMVDDDARLSLRAAEAELAALQAQVSRAEFDLKVAEAKAGEAGDRLARVRNLIPEGGASEIELVQADFRARAAEGEIESARAEIEVAKANVLRQAVGLDEAKLQLSRMEIRSPVSGIVMSRLVEPGTRISMTSRTNVGAAAISDTMSGTVARLYDPAKLQVRAEIPLADSAKIRIGCRAQITTEALPDKTLHGSVTRIVHEANIQRNTIQVKILIDDPVAALKPEMLTRVRLYAAPAAGAHSEHATSSLAPSENAGSNAGSAKPGQPGLRLIVPISALVNRQDDAADVWAVRKMHGGECVAERRRVSLAAEEAGGAIEVLSGVRLGDRLIVDPPQGLGDGTRVRISGEKTVESAGER